MDENVLEPGPAVLQGQAGVVKAILEITRADTGKIEVVEIVGTVIQPDEEQPT